MRRTAGWVAVFVVTVGLVAATTARVRAGALELTVPYCAGRQLLMDVYEPGSRSEAAPMVLYVHGGAWRSGSRRDSGDLFPELLPRLLGAGDVVAAADYRLSGAAPWPAPAQDVGCAIAYLRGHAAQLGGDPDRIRLYGTSAGGQLAAYTGTRRVAGVDRIVDLYGPADLTAPGWSPWLREDIGAEFGTRAVALRTASPALASTRGDPPLLIVQGDCDQVVPPAQSRELLGAWRARGNQARLIWLHGAGHGLWTCGGRGRPADVAPVVAEIATYLSD